MIGRLRPQVDPHVFQQIHLVVADAIDHQVHVADGPLAPELARTNALPTARAAKMRVGDVCQAEHALRLCQKLHVGADAEVIGGENSLAVRADLGLVKGQPGGAHGGPAIAPGGGHEDVIEAAVTT